MNGKDLSRQLGDLPEEMIAEAMVPAKRLHRKQSTRRLLRLAAVAAALAILLTALSFWPAREENYVTGPGVFVVRAYGVENDSNLPVEGVVLEEGVQFMPNLTFNPAQSYVERVPFTFSVDENLYSGMQITLEVSTNAGIFYKNEPFDPALLEMTPTEQLMATYYGQNFTVGIDKALYWDPWGFDYEYMYEQYENGVRILEKTFRPYYLTSNPSFIDVIIRADGNIIGYCVIEIRLLDGEMFEIQEFGFELLAMISFPQVDGRYQNVSKKYVREQIEACKASKMEAN